MPFSGMLHRVTLVRTDVLEERIASIIRVTRTGELGTKLAATSDRSVTVKVVPSSQFLVTLMMVTIRSSETSAITTATWRNIPEDDIPFKPELLLFEPACSISDCVDTKA
jgi:hypothetical protein